MGKPWLATLCLMDVVQRLPLFVARYVEEQDGKEDKGKFYGNFVLGQGYNFSAFKDSESFSTLFTPSRCV